MAAPIYRDAQIAAMMAMPKFIDHDAWQNRFDGRFSTEEMRKRIDAFPLDESDSTQFAIEACKCSVRGEASFTLFGKIAGYTECPLCRYEIQICPHTNPKWHQPYSIPRRALHRHVYNERAIREGFPWDKCADLISQKKQPKRKLSLAQAIERLTPIFLDDIRVEIRDPDIRGLFFRGA